jgi:Fe/S biogenesis protein NfuA
MNSLADKKVNIHITETALHHFADLIKKEEQADMGLRIFLDRPGFPKAEVGITFCPPGDNKAGDIILEHDEFKLFIDKTSAPYLEQANIDFKTDNMGGQLEITAPNLRGPKPDKESPLKDQIEYIINSEINPNLASHGGVVSLVDITEDNVVVLRFGGGCHGCGMVDVTLKQGIEGTLKEQLPQIKEVRDSTDHSTGENPYY